MGALRILYVLREGNLLHNIHLILQFIQEDTTPDYGDHSTTTCLLSTYTLVGARAWQSSRRSLEIRRKVPLSGEV